MKTTLLIMAAGIGSRFGGGIKQLEPVDRNKHIIMDYSIHDAIAAGFNKIIFIIRKDIEEDFRSVIGDRIEKICSQCGVEVGYAFQSLDDIPGELPEGRKKPWGTGQAVLSAKELIDSPFAVINADDYYGKEAYVRLHEHLTSGSGEFCMAGFVLKNTLSENGGVTRGVCRVEDGRLIDIVETSGIERTEAGVRSGVQLLDENSSVSMNMWGLMPEFMGTLEEKFREFFEKKVPENPLKAEYLLPILIGELLREGKVTVRVLPTNDQWFGVTYMEDKPFVVESFRRLIENGVYSEDLFSDLK